MSRYRETLYKWAAQYIPEGGVVISVDVEEDEGYRYSSYTYQDPSVDVWISWSLNGVPQSPTYADIENLGTILTELFAIEDAEDAAL